MTHPVRGEDKHPGRNLSEEQTLAGNLNQPPTDYDGTLFGQEHISAEMAKASSRPPEAETLIAGGQARQGGEGPEFQPGAVWGNDFAIGPLLGKGGMGSVFKGRQLSLDRPVAIKVLPEALSSNENFRKRFLLEAKAVAQISSPHVIQVFSAGEHKGHHFFVMEFVEGKDLSRRLKEGFRPSKQQSLDFITQAARGLGAASRHGIIHRDIKPGNMMVTDRLELKLMDFGLVKLAKENTALTMTGTVMGTVSYFSPEQGRGESCDHRTDLYALGVVFYELLTGTLPFTGNDATSIIYQHVHCEPRRPKEIDPTIPESFQAVVLKCLQKNPADRYQDADELLRDLDDVARGAPPRSAMSDPRGVRSGGTMVRTASFRHERHHTRTLVVLLGTVVAAAGGAFVAYQNGWFHGPRSSTAHTSVHTDAPVVPMVGPVPTQPVNTSGEAAARIARLEQEARDALARGDLDQAKPKVAEILALAPEHPTGLGLKASVDTISLIRDGITAAKNLLKSGEPIRARTRLADLEGLLKLAPRSDREEVERLRNICEGMQTFLDTACKALIGGDLAAARTAYSASVAQFANDPAQRGLEVVGVCESFHKAVDEGNLKAARVVIDDLVKAKADERLIDAYRLEVQKFEVVLAVAAAIGQREFATAETSLAKLRNLAPTAKEIPRLEQRLVVGRCLAAFDKALTDRNLVEAKTQLEALGKAEGKGPVFLDATTRLQASRLDEEARDRERQQKEQAVAARAAGIERDLAASSPDFPALTKAIEVFAQENGADRPEVARLKQSLIERQQDLAVRSRLAELDRAVLAGQADAVKAIVADAAHAEALKAMIGQPELTFAHSITSLRHDGTAVVVEAALRTSMRAVPETRLSYRYRFQANGQVWVITSVTQAE